MPERIILSVDAGATHCRLQFFAFRQDFLEAVSPASKFAWDFSSLAGSDEFRNAAVDSPIGSNEQRAGQHQIDQLSEHILAQWAAQTSSQFSCILAWPGIKNAAADSVIRCANGPRILSLTQRLKAHLDDRLNPTALYSVYPLVSDGTMAGWGEWSHPQGGLFQLESGYLVMAGTGLAEAFLVDGRILGRMDLGLPGAFDVYRGTQSYEQCLNGRAWGEDGPQQLGSALLDWITIRHAHFLEHNIPITKRLVLGGRASAERLSTETLEALKAFGCDVVFSQLEDPALWGAAYYALQHGLAT